MSHKEDEPRTTDRGPRTTDVEQLLRQLRPAAPSAELRARILAARRPQKRTWPWAAAAAAILLFTVLLRSTDTKLAAALAPEPSPWEAEARLLADMLGGDADAESLADQIVALNRLTARDAAPEPLDSRESQ